MRYAGILIRSNARSPERAQRPRAFLLTLTYMDVGIPDISTRNFRYAGDTAGTTIKTRCNHIIPAMSGVAVVMTFLLFAVVGVAGASVVSFCLFFYARNRARLTGRKPGVVILTTVAPFLALVWLIAAFILHVWISNNLAHQDCGFDLSPDPWIRLPNGYELGSHNTYDGSIAKFE